MGGVGATEPRGSGAACKAGTPAYDVAGPSAETCSGRIGRISVDAEIGFDNIVIYRPLRSGQPGRFSTWISQIKEEWPIAIEPVGQIRCRAEPVSPAFFRVQASSPEFLRVTQ